MNNLLHTPEGVRDIYGTEYAKKLKLEELIRQEMKSFGYKDIQTPTIEFFDVFSKEIGTTPSKELYKFFDKEGNTMVLRPDFTPSMARCAAKYFMEEEFPIRFCYSGNTFTNTSSLQGKLKEVTQMGSELIGDASIEADAEMIALLIGCLRNTGLTNFQVSIGEVDYFKGLCDEAGLDEITSSALRENISGKNIFAVEDLIKEKEIDEKYSKALLKLTELFGSVEILKDAKEMTDNSRSKKAVERLEKLYELLTVYGVQEYVSFDLGMLSNLQYYTGVIFRAYTYGIGDAIVKGGRYDNLLKQFGKDAAAIGFVVIIDDLMTALSSQKINIAAAEDNALIVYEQSSFHKAISKALELRGQGMNVEMIQKDPVKTTENYMTFARQNLYCHLFFEYDDIVKEAF